MSITKTPLRLSLNNSDRGACPEGRRRSRGKRACERPEATECKAGRDALKGVPIFEIFEKKISSLVKGTPWLTSYMGDINSDFAVDAEACRQAKIQALKTLYLKDIRHNPERYFGESLTIAYNRLADSAAIQKEFKHAPAWVVTYNPPHLEDDVAKLLFRSLLRHISVWKWISGLYYVMELSPDTHRPHLHMVLHLSKVRHQCDIHRQIWTCAHNAYHTKKFPSITSPLHTRLHLDVRPITNGRRGVYTAIRYIYKDEKVLARGPIGNTEFLDQCWDKFNLVKEQEEKIDE